MAAAVTPVLLAGGAGTRLWPMSRQLRPKQLLPLTGRRTMLEETASRVLGPAFAAPVVMCNEDHRFMIAEQMRAAGIAPAAIMLEPVARNTAPAVAAAAVWLAERDPDVLMLVLPTDHVIADVPGFHRAVETAAPAARAGRLVAFGVGPTRPETGYGYIRRGAPLPGLDGCYAMDAFVEKPDAATAAAYVASGAYAWNSGMFVTRAVGFLEELERLQPSIVDGCRRAVAGAREDLDFLRLAHGPFEGVPSVSADAAVMEATNRGAVVSVDIGWNDIGAWTALWDIGDHDADGNVTTGDVITHDVHDCYLRGENNLVAALGVRDLVIVATDDVVLVVPRTCSQDVKALVERIESAGRTEHYVHSKVFRPWGWYQRIDAGPRFTVKQIVVNPGERTSRQMHHHRAEHWVVVSGTAKVTKDTESFFLTEDESTYIPHHTPHMLENPGRMPLCMIEVQSGGYVGEDDIVRFDDHYGRAGVDD